MQLRSNLDFVQGDFEMFSRVWRSIESLSLISGLLKKNMQETSVYEDFLSIKLVLNFSSGAYLGEIKLEKLTITLKYASDTERISYLFDNL